MTPEARLRALAERVDDNGSLTVSEEQRRGIAEAAADVENGFTGVRWERLRRLLLAAKLMEESP